MGLFWVVGGEDADASFREFIGDRETWIGPFADYESARHEWAKHAWPSEDHCTARYRIECIDPDQPPPCTD